MAIELRILSGARGGQTEAFEKSVVAIGRHPMSDLRFDPHQDLDVSTKHAEIRGLDGRYTLYDAGSTNGTFVNGDRVSGSRELRDGDVLSFGAQGPEAAFHVVVSAMPPAAPAPPPTAQRRSTPPVPPAARPMSSVPERLATTERVAIAVREETRGLRRMLGGAVLVFGGLAVAIWWSGRREAAVRDEQIHQLIALNEQTSRDFETRLRGMNDTALTNALRRRTDSLMQVARAGARAPKERSAAIQSDLARNQQLQRAFVDMDLPSVRQANDPAVVLITTDLGQGLEATGFTVTADGLVITNRHVVADSAGRAKRITLKFANTGESHRAHIVGTASGDNNDLALLQIDDRGPFPTVKGVSRSAADVPVGSPTATLGFPLGTDAAMEGSGATMVAKTTLTVGFVSKIVSDRLQLDTYAGHGSSGSPVFDEHGHVIGVIWSGAIGSGGRIVYAVPADRILDLLPPEARSALAR